MLAKFELAVKVRLLVNLVIEEVGFLDAAGAQGDMLLHQLRNIQTLAEKYINERNIDPKLSPDEKKFWTMELTDDQTIPPRVQDNVSAWGASLKLIFQGDEWKFQRYRHADVAADYLWMLEEALSWRAGSLYARELQLALPGH